MSYRSAFASVMILSCLLTMSNLIPQSARAVTVPPLVQEFPAPTIAAPPLKIVAGSNGDLWFNQYQTNTLTRFIFKDQHFRTYHTLGSFSYPKDFAIDNDDHPWFSASTASRDQSPYGRPGIIGHLSPDTGRIIRYQPITTDIPYLLEVGEDATIWYVTNNLFGHITRQGTAVEFVKPEFTYGVRLLIPGTDGDMWFAMTGGKIGKVTPQGHFTEYIPPQSRGEHITNMVRGADGNFWFLEPKVNKVGRVTPLGNITMYPIPALYNAANWSGMTSGPDGNLWFTDPDNNQIVSMTLQRSFTAYPLPTPSSKPSGIIGGQDGALWFIESGVNKIARFLPPSLKPQSLKPQPLSFQEFLVPQQSLGPQIILPGPGGDIWFSEVQTSSIGRITTQGVLLSHYVTPQIYKFGGTLSELARGKDGNLWFPYDDGFKFVRMTPNGHVTTFLSLNYHWCSSFSANGDGNVWFLAGYDSFGYISPQGKIKEFGFPPDSSAYNGNAAHLTSGPDNNLWITETAKNKIGRLTHSGGITEYAIPSAPPVLEEDTLPPAPPSSLPTLITGGSDGNVWFLETNGDKLGRITPQGHITEFPLKEHLADVRGMTFAADGNLWLTDVGQLIRVTPAGIESTYQLASDSYVDGITSGPDGNLWFADGGAGKIGRLQLVRSR